MVRHLGSHFSCAVRESGLWFYIDDLQDNCTSFPTLQHLLHGCPTGWFFGIYNVISAHQQTNNTILDISSVSTSLRKLQSRTKYIGTFQFFSNFKTSVYTKLPLLRPPLTMLANGPALLSNIVQGCGRGEMLITVTIFI